MGNDTVNKKEKPEYIQGAAGPKEPTIITNMILQNNEPHKIHIEITNSGKPASLPFMIEDGELIAENDVYVVTKAKDEMSREEFNAKKARIEKERANSGIGR